MKNIKNIIFASLVVVAASCMKVDTYDAPDASLYGRIIDPHTGENIQLSFCSDEMKLRIIEQNEAYPNPQPQELNISQDGSFRNDYIFRGRYLATLLNGAFTYNDTIEINTLDSSGPYVLEATPHFRIHLTMPDTIYSIEDFNCSYRITRDTGNTHTIKDIMFINNRWDVVDRESGKSNTITDIETNPYILSDVDSIYTFRTIPNQGSGTYYFRVGVLAVGMGYYNYSNIEKVYLTKEVFVVSTPKNITLMDTTSTSLDIEWDPVKFVDTYRVRYDTDSTFSSNPVEIELEENQHTFSGLKPSTEYYFGIRAENEVSISEYSETVMFKTSIEQ